jgi:hypothetical protein
VRLERLNPGNVVLAAVLTMSKAIHDGKFSILSVLGGHTVTLPTSVGSGATFYFFESVAPTSNSTVIKVGNSTDIMQGSIGVTGTTSGVFGTTTTSDTITENRTTTGGAVAGGWVELVDIIAGIWHVRGSLNGSGTVVTPFSATV